MGILEIAVAALSVMGGTTVCSAITGAVMGSRREIGGVPGIPLGAVAPRGRHRKGLDKRQDCQA